MPFTASSTDAGMKGVMVSAILPLIGAFMGCYKFSLGVKKAREEAPLEPIGNFLFVGNFMVAVCAVYGFVGAGVLSGVLHEDPPFVPGNTVLAAGLMNGLTSSISAVGQGFFASAAVQAGVRQRRLWVGYVLIMIYIEAFALYGLIVALVTSAKANMALVDMTPDAVVPFASVFVLANAGGVVGSTAAGFAIMDIGVERPDLVMRSIIPVVFNGVTGIYGFISTLVDAGSWPPKGNDSLAGLFYLLSSAGLTYVGYHGVKDLPQDPRGFVTMVVKLVGCQSIGLFGLIYGLLKAQAAAGDGMPRVSTSFASTTLLGQGLAPHGTVSFFALVLFAAPLLAAFVLGARRQRQEPLEVSLLA